MKRLLYILTLSLLIGSCTKEQSLQEEGNNYRITTEANDIYTNKLIDVINCPINPQVEIQIKVPPIYKTNNLRKRTGYGSFAKGKFIVISGIITDSYCVPVKNATVQIWHGDYKGNYKSVPNDGYLNDSLMYSKQLSRFEESFTSEDIDENFTGSGSTTTDNLGRFTFLSIMPGGNNPLVNFRVIHKDFNEVKTVMYFSPKTGVNQLLIAKKNGTIDNDGVKEDLYQYNIVLKEKNKYLNY
jgi:protocatechuate 3,4-dioxygenase beta subunit